MSAKPSPPDLDSHRARALSATAFGVAWLAGLAVLVAVPHRDVVRGLLFVLLGTASLGLATHGSGDARAATTSPGFWQAAARHAWLTGGLGSVLFFVGALSAPSSSIGDMSYGMAMAIAPTVWGLALAMFFGLIGVRIDRRMHDADLGQLAPSAWARALGSLILLGLVGATIVQLPLETAGHGLQAWALLLHWPAILLVAGAAASAIVAAGGGLRGEAAAPACAAAGTLGALVGLVVALTGFAQQDIGRITAGVSFMITACATGLLGLMAVDVLRQSVDPQHRAFSSSVVRAAWVLFPLVAILFLIIVFLLVVTPMTRRL